MRRLSNINKNISTSIEVKHKQKNARTTRTLIKGGIEIRFYEGYTNYKEHTLQITRSSRNGCIETMHSER